MKTNAHILIVDDDTDILISARILLKQYFTKISICNDPKELDQRLTTEDIHAVLLDMNYQKGRNDGREGVYWLKRIKEINPYCAVVMMTAYGDVLKAVESLKSGAADYILKPWDAEALPKLIKSALIINTATTPSIEEKTTTTNASLNTQIVTGKSMDQVLKTIEKAAPTDANILLLGENGTGKQIFAERIHQLSKRVNATFVHVDLGSLSNSLFESALFGYSKGAFTDAKENKTGYFEEANQGTIFLDEIGNLPLELQSKLLQVLQNRVIYKLGESKPIPINVRIVCATNMDLNKMVASGSFRQDLLYRINTISIELPPLRKRQDEIALLAHHFLQKYNHQYSVEKSLPEKTIQYLKTYAWPGNIRELMHVIERAVILSENSDITPLDLNIVPSDVVISEIQNNLEIESMEKNLIIKALQKNEGNITKAASELGLSRNALYRRMEKYSL
ncbi:MAG: sigma-54-dependent Fis family transcriptional regulator [Pseudopedobacter saltans]|uniref:Sigma-54-dependent Fis family transcriptional regulator n=1 Tax=Pseudopedobacter saltans TaxID=151895 RepID=A0A2W5ETH3_9SPHI|nr:MAG: sigma-54-dependent Fis family transcriptional regulator [Pseudopedobacter saltans]